MLRYQSLHKSPRRWKDTFPYIKKISTVMMNSRLIIYIRLINVCHMFAEFSFEELFKCAFVTF